jgi:predicted transposase YdaD
MARPTYDNILKQLASQAPEGFFAWLAHTLRMEPAIIENRDLPSELPTAPRYADVVWLIRIEAEHAILHIELQLEFDETMSERLLGYQARLIERYHLPVISIVIWLKKTRDIPTSPAIWSWRGQEANRCVFQTIKLWELPQEDILNAPYPHLWPIAGLMAKATGESVARVGQQIADTSLKEGVKSELIGFLSLLASIQLKAETIRAAFRRHPMINELWKHSSIAQELIAEGREEGRKEEALRMTRVALERRFGSLDETLLAALEQADIATLEDIALDAALTIEQVRARVGFQQ